MLAYLKKFWVEAKKTLTAWLAVATGLIASIAARAEDLLNEIPQLKTFLPPGPAITKFIAMWIIPPLGLLTAWARVRRILRPPGS
jgi:hypothetical protein